MLARSPPPGLIGGPMWRPWASAWVLVGWVACGQYLPGVAPTDYEEEDEVAGSARAHSYFLGSEVWKKCKFWL